jgi:acetolactate synthase-1/2/3 large subunit
MGVTGMDFEACVRYKKPVIAVVFNNSEWIGAAWEYLYMTGVHGSNKVIQDQRYDLMFEPIGVHGEFCTRPEQIKPALERAANSGKPAIVNCIVDPYFYHPWCLVFLLGGYLRWFGPKRCQELNIYPERFWKDVVEPFPGGAEGIQTTLRSIGHLVGI